MDTLNKETKQRASRRLALYYLSELKAAEEKYLLSEKYLMEFSSVNVGDWEQIKHFLLWAKKNSDEDIVAKKLRNDFIECAPNLLSALQSSEERLDWLAQAREVAHQLEKLESEIAHLGNMAIVCRNTGKVELSIRLCEELHNTLENKSVLEDANVLTLLGEALRTDGRRIKEAIALFELALISARIASIRSRS